MCLRNQEALNFWGQIKLQQSVVKSKGKQSNSNSKSKLRRTLPEPGKFKAISSRGTIMKFIEGANTLGNTPVRTGGQLDQTEGYN